MDNLLYKILHPPHFTVMMEKDKNYGMKMSERRVPDCLKKGKRRYKCQLQSSP